MAKESRFLPYPYFELFRSNKSVLPGKITYFPNILIGVLYHTLHESVNG